MEDINVKTSSKEKRMIYVNERDTNEEDDAVDNNLLTLIINKFVVTSSFYHNTCQTTDRFSRQIELIHEYTYNSRMISFHTQ
jgi:hypothetical protein